MTKPRKKIQVDQEQDELLSRIDERQIAMMEKIESILVQTTATNGRVTKLEHWRSRLAGVWLSVVIGSTVIGTIAGFVFAYLNPNK
jgi:ABC-type glucose/galactose transport system permease subunit